MSQAEYYDITRRLDALEAAVAALKPPPSREPPETENPYHQEAAHKGKRAR